MNDQLPFKKDVNLTDHIKLRTNEPESMANDFSIVYCNSKHEKRFDGEDPIGQAKAYVQSLRNWGSTGHWKLTSPRTMPDDEGNSVVWRWCTDELGETDYSVHWCRRATVVRQRADLREESFYKIKEEPWRDKYPYGNR